MEIWTVWLFLSYHIKISCLFCFVFVLFLFLFFWHLLNHLGLLSLYWWHDWTFEQKRTTKEQSLIQLILRKWGFEVVFNAAAIPDTSISLLPTIPKLYDSILHWYCQGWIKWFLPQEQDFKMKISSIDFLTQIDVLTNNVQNLVTNP